MQNKHFFNEQKIKYSLKCCAENHPPGSSSNKLIRKASVLMPLLVVDNEWHILFTRRTDTLQFHKGQVSFPGGVIEAGDEGPIGTALRESFEEIALKADDVTILGCLPEYTSLTNYLITPVVGRINWPIDLCPNPDEVQRIFTIPVEWLANAENLEWRPYQSPEGRIHQVIFYRRYDGEELWGITARITVTLLNTIGFLK